VRLKNTTIRGVNMNNSQINNKTKNMGVGIVERVQNMSTNRNGKTILKIDTALSFSLIEILNEKIIRSKELTDITKKQNKKIKMSDLSVGTVDPKKFDLEGRGSFC